MLLARAEQIIAELNAYMAKFGHPNHMWYVGIAADPKQRLFVDHAVNEQYGAWAHFHAGDSETARGIENAYHAAGFDGGPGGGDWRTVFIYAYLKTTTTVQ
jgi:hypothetical protein